jgi:hypothetical protein
VRFGSVNGRYQKCDGKDFIPVSLHSGSKFSKKKKKNLSILKFWKADPRCYYIFTLRSIFITRDILLFFSMELSLGVIICVCRFEFIDARI